MEFGRDSPSGMSFLQFPKNFPGNFGNFWMGKFPGNLQENIRKFHQSRPNGPRKRVGEIPNTVSDSPRRDTSKNMHLYPIRKILDQRKVRLV